MLKKQQNLINQLKQIQQLSNIQSIPNNEFTMLYQPKVSNEYNGMIFNLKLKPSIDNYPPTIWFIDIPYHLNIDQKSGKLLAKILDEEWCDFFNFKMIFQQIRNLISSPDISKSTNQKIRNQYLSNKQIYKTKMKQFRLLMQNNNRTNKNRKLSYESQKNKILFSPIQMSIKNSQHNLTRKTSFAQISKQLDDKFIYKQKDFRHIYTHQRKKSKNLIQPILDCNKSKSLRKDSINSPRISSQKVKLQNKKTNNIIPLKQTQKLKRKFILKPQQTIKNQVSKKLNKQVQIKEKQIYIKASQKQEEFINQNSLSLMIPQLQQVPQTKLSFNECKQCLQKVNNYLTTFYQQCKTIQNRLKSIESQGLRHILETKLERQTKIIEKLQIFAIIIKQSIVRNLQNQIKNI